MTCWVIKLFFVSFSVPEFSRLARLLEVRFYRSCSRRSFKGLCSPKFIIESIGVVSFTSRIWFRPSGEPPGKPGMPLGPKGFALGGSIAAGAPASSSVGKTDPIVVFLRMAAPPYLVLASLLLREASLLSKDCRVYYDTEPSLTSSFCLLSICCMEDSVFPVRWVSSVLVTSDPSSS